jgi:hypothetical protein
MDLNKTVEAEAHTVEAEGTSVVEAASMDSTVAA